MYPYVMQGSSRNHNSNVQCPCCDTRGAIVRRESHGIAMVSFTYTCDTCDSMWELDNNNETEIIVNKHNTDGYCMCCESEEEFTKVGESEHIEEGNDTMIDQMECGGCGAIEDRTTI